MNANVRWSTPRRSPFPMRWPRLQGITRGLGRVPDSLIALLARFSVAAVFWQSGQTKIQGLVLDLVHRRFEFGWPQLADTTVDLFRDEYALPILSPEAAAYLAASAEHVFPVMLLLGVGTRFSALALLAMTLVIQFFVYPAAYATHGVWAAALLYLIARGPGRLSVDHMLAQRLAR